MNNLSPFNQGSLFQNFSSYYEVIYVSFYNQSGLPWWLSNKKSPPAYAGDTGSTPESGRSPGKGNGKSLQYACLENPMDREEPGEL